MVGAQNLVARKKSEERGRDETRKYYPLPSLFVHHMYTNRATSHSLLVLSTAPMFSSFCFLSPGIAAATRQKNYSSTYFTVLCSYLHGNMLRFNGIQVIMLGRGTSHLAIRNFRHQSIRQLKVVCCAAETLEEFDKIVVSNYLVVGLRGSEINLNLLFNSITSINRMKNNTV